MSGDRTLRVVLQQPALPRYRYPLFQALSRLDNVDLVIRYARDAGKRNVDPGELNASFVDTKIWHTRFGPLMWDPSQWRSAKRRACDVLILTWNTRYLSLVPALLRARRHGIATILWGHGHSKRDSRVKLWLRRAVTRLADAVVFYDASAASSFVADIGESRSTFVAPNAIDQGPIEKARDEWKRSPDRLKAFRLANGLEHGPVIAFISRVRPERRLDLLVDAVATLTSDYPGVQLVVIGDGDAEMGRLTDRAADLGISDRIRFLGAIFDESELAPWLLSADVMACPAAIGLSVLTAFGFGLPVIASDSRASNGPEWAAIRHGENGLHFSAGNTASLAGALRKVFTDDEARLKMSDEALSTVRTQFTLDETVDGLENAIRYCATKL